MPTGYKKLPFVASILVCPFLIVLLPAGTVAGQDKDTPPITVDRVDLSRYAGKWFEIAKIPNWFQKSCAAGTTAEYIIRPDGNIEVINRCLQEDGSVKEAKGLAKIVNPPANSRLKVSFVRFLRRQWFWGDYWIIGLDDEYQYALIGTPDRKYGWILARQPELSPSELNIIYQTLKEQGYDPADFKMTRHRHGGRPAE